MAEYGDLPFIDEAPSHGDIWPLPTSDYDDPTGCLFDENGDSCGMPVVALRYSFHDGWLAVCKEHRDTAERAFLASPPSAPTGSCGDVQ